MNTSLHIAIQNGNIEIVKTLLADGCDLNARNAEGQTPLELATALNNEEIVRVLLEQNTSHTVPPPKIPIFSAAASPLDVPQRKKRITFWLIMCLVLLGLVSLLGFIHSFVDIAIWLNNPPYVAGRMSFVASMIYLVLFSFPSLAGYLLCYFFFLLRIWEEVPREFARTAPTMAAGLSCIPVFGWYWMFVALGGLYQDMNKTMESYGHSKRFNATMMIVVCILWLASDLFSCMIGFSVGMLQTILREPEPLMLLFHLFMIVWSIVYLAFTAVMYFIIRKNVLEFVDIKESLGRHDEEL